MKFLTTQKLKLKHALRKRDRQNDLRMTAWHDDERLGHFDFSLVGMSGVLGSSLHQLNRFENPSLI